jgi:hypothetical protein
MTVAQARSAALHAMHASLGRVPRYSYWLCLPPLCGCPYESFLMPRMPDSVCKHAKGE